MLALVNCRLISGNEDIGKSKFGDINLKKVYINDSNYAAIDEKNDVRIYNDVWGNERIHFDPTVHTYSPWMIISGNKSKGLIPKAVVLNKYEEDSKVLAIMFECDVLKVFWIKNIKGIIITSSWVHCETESIIGINRSIIRCRCTDGSIHTIDAFDETGVGKVYKPKLSYWHTGEVEITNNNNGEFMITKNGININSNLPLSSMLENPSKIVTSGNIFAWINDGKVNIYVLYEDTIITCGRIFNSKDIFIYSVNDHVILEILHYDNIISILSIDISQSIDEMIKVIDTHQGKESDILRLPECF